MTPPKVGATTGASTVATPTTAMTRPIRLGPAASAIIICPIGPIMPPPTPWTTRNTTRTVIEWARPHSAEPAVKSTRAAM